MNNMSEIRETNKMNEIPDEHKIEIISTLYNKCKEARLGGDNKRAYSYFLLCMKVLDIDYLNCSLDKFPIEISSLVYQLFDEFCIFSFYVNKKKEGLIISDKLLFNYTASQLLNTGLLARNQKYYMNKLNVKDKKQIVVTCEENYVGMNPSIIKRNNGYLLNFRTSNFGLKSGGIYYCRSPDGVIDTINYILELDGNLNVLTKRRVHDVSKTKVYPRNNIRGLEDLIIFEIDTELWGTCTLLDAQPNHVPLIGLCKLKLENDEYFIKNKRPLLTETEGRCEKNWLPVYHDGKIKLVYGYSPTQVRTPCESIEHIKLEEGYLNTKILVSFVSKLKFDRFRGSGGPILFNNGWLIIVHEVSWNHDNSRVYTHRFVYLNKEFEITKLSDPWYFESHGIEFCRSMCESINGEDIIITCGLKDEEAWCYIMEKEKITLMLKDLQEFEL